jgi:hypothetical protein
VRMSLKTERVVPRQLGRERAGQGVEELGCPCASFGVGPSTLIALGTVAAAPTR